MHHLSQCMHTRVGPPGTNGGHLVSSQLGQRGLELILQCLATRLGLPSGRSCTIVGQPQRDPQGG